MNDLKHRAQGQWYGILTAQGLPARALRNKHQPCPVCGGKDRFRFDDKQGHGTFFCNHCGAGDGFRLLMLWLGCDFKTAAERVRGHFGFTTDQSAAPARPMRPAPPPKPEADQSARLQAMWQAARPLADDDPVCAYLRGRGLGIAAPVSAELRFAPALAYWVCGQNGTFRQLGVFPAILAAIRGADGVLQGIHQTYLQRRGGRWQKADLRHPDTGEALPAKKMRSCRSGSVSGAAVRLDPVGADGSLLVCEGIETALAARQLFGLPVWAALSANGMKQLKLPEGLDSLLVCADHDEPRPIGFEAAHALAVRAIGQGVRVRLWQPDYCGDALDELNRRQKPLQKP